MLSPYATQLLAAGVLAAIASLPLILWVNALRRTEFTAGQALLLALNHPVSRVLWRAQIQGRIDIGLGQGAVVVCNHRGSLDPAVIGLTVDRMIHWMVAREYVNNPFIGWFFRIVGVIPAKRNGADTAATKAAIRIARNGGLVGIFPEGRINDTNELMLPCHSGATLIALKARVPVVPCYVEGSPYDGTVWGCLFMSAKIRLVVGRPIDLSAHFEQARDRQVLAAITRQLQGEIAALAGHPEYEPRLADTRSQKG